MRLLPYSLQRRFLAGLVVIVLVTGTFFVLLLRYHMNDLFLSEARSKANLMVSHVESIQDYVRSVLRPITSQLIGSDEFIIEAMSSSYVSRRILSGLHMQDDDFTYRRVAKNARNPNYEVNARESQFFNQFLQSPEAKRKEEIIRVNGKKHLVVARPVYFNDSCMRCHGEPENAPSVLLNMYGSERGFHRESGELAGLDIISVPMESATGAISKSITVFALCFGLGMLLLLLSVQGFFNRLVVHNLRRVGHILHQNFPQEENRAVLAPLRKETEIEGMIQSIEVVASHLGEARQQLSDYAKNLEGMVRERTADLEAVLKSRSADVRIFMRLLSDLNSNQEKRTLLRTSLSLISNHLGASRAVYVCGLSGTDYQEWPGLGPQLPPEEKERLFRQFRSSEPAMEEGVWYIPVQTSGQTRGILGLYWEKTPGEARGQMDEACDPEAQPQLPERIMEKGAKGTYFPLAVSLGRQLGIALDNLDALDVLLRQNDLLDSLVEGVNDPLILVEQDMTPVLANSPARELAIRLLVPHDPADQAGEAGGIDASADLASSCPLIGPSDASGAGSACISSLLGLLGLKRDKKDPILPVQYEIVLENGDSFMVNVHPLCIGAMGTGGAAGTSEPSSGGSSGALRAVVHLRETTEEKRILGHMRQTEKLAAVGQLAAGLAHEINNPLGVIRCYAELLGASSLDEQGRADLKIILRHVDQAQSVLRDMLNFSRPHEACPGPCNVEQALHGLQEIFRPQARAAKVELLLDVEPDLPDLYADRNMLEQVIVNLLLNALDAVKKAHPGGGGLLTLLARHESGNVVISVADNGPGVHADILPKIFDPFFTTKEPGKGTGLGLTIAFGMVNDLGGRIEVESPSGGDKNNRGTVFHVTLPAGVNLPNCDEYAENIDC